MGLWATLFGAGDEQERGDRIDAQREELNRQKLASGEWTAAQYDQSQINSGKARVDVDDQISQQFSEGWSDGKSNIEKTFWSGTANFLGSIPSLVWIAGFVGVFLYLGGFAWTLKKAKKAFA